MNQVGTGDNLQPHALRATAAKVKEQLCHAISSTTRVYGNQPVCFFKRYLHALKIDSCADGVTIVKGWRTCHIRQINLS